LVASQLMPDVFMPVAALAIYLLAFRAPAMQRGEKIVLGIVVTAAMASHMAALALSVAIVAFLALVRPLWAELRLPRLHLAPAALAVALGVLLAPLSNLAIAGRFAFTPGGANFLFGRLIESGIVARYLSEKCPDPTIKLCVFRADLPATGDEWLWGEASPLRELGGTDGFGAEAQRIALTSLLLYPGQHLKAALTSATEQFFNVELAAGEKVAAEVEAKARSVGIAARTYDRARQRLGIMSRRVGFGRKAKYLMALPVVHATPNASTEAGAT